MGTVPNCPFSRFNPKKKMKTVAVLLVAIVGLGMASALPPKARSLPITYKQAMKAKSIQCDICQLIVTEIDNLITSAQTMDELINLVEKLCGQLDGVFPGFGATCNNLVETYLPQIIEGLVNNQLSPASVCKTLTLCSALRL